MGPRIHHFGLAVPDLAAGFADSIHDPFGEPVHDPIQRCHLQLASAGGIAGPPWVELIQPDGPASPVWRSVQTHGVHWHHLCLEFAERAGAETFARERRLLRVTPWQPAVLFAGRPVAFFYTRQRELLEILADAPR